MKPSREQEQSKLGKDLRLQFLCMSLHAVTYLNGRYIPFQLKVEGTGSPKRKMLRELIRISVVAITLLRLVFDSTGILAAGWVGDGCM
jgi:hypothetical protein